MRYLLYVVFFYFCTAKLTEAQTSTVSIVTQMNSFVGVHHYQSTVFGNKIVAKAEVKKNASGSFEIIFNDATTALNDLLPQPLQNGKTYPLFDERTENNSTQIHLIYAQVGELKLFNNRNQVTKITRYYLALLPMQTSAATGMQNLVFYTVDWNAATGMGSKQPLLANVVQRAGGSTATVLDNRFVLTPDKLKAALQQPVLQFQTITNSVKPSTITNPLPAADQYVFYFDKIEALAVDADDCKNIYHNKAEYFLDVSVVIYNNLQVLHRYPSELVATPVKPSAYGYPINNGLLLQQPFLLTKKPIQFTVQAGGFNQYSLSFEGSIAEMKYCPGGDYDFINPVVLLSTSNKQTISFSKLQLGSNILELEKNGKKLRLHYFIEPVKNN